MKIKSILLAGLIALGFAACNNEDVPQVEQKGEATVSVKVKTAGKDVTTRSLLDLDEVTAEGLTNESKIQHLEVYVFNAITKQLDAYKDVEDINGVTEVNDISVKPGNAVIYVVANVGLGKDDYGTVSALEAAVEDLMIVADDKLPMTGISNEITLEPGQNYYGYEEAKAGKPGKLHSEDSPLMIERVVARVALISTKLQIEDPIQKEIFDGLKDVEVAIFNVPKASGLFGDAGDLAQDTDYMFGGQDSEGNWPSPGKSYVVGEYNGDLLEDAVNATDPKDFVIPAANKLVPTFYVTENTATEKTFEEDDEVEPQEQMLLVLRGKPTLGGNEVTSEGLYTTNGYTYYPIWVNKTGNSGNGNVLRNTQYNVSLTIKGIGNPTIDEVEDAWLDVLVDVEDWKQVGQNVTWGPNGVEP